MFCWRSLSLPKYTRAYCVSPPYFYLKAITAWRQKVRWHSPQCLWLPRLFVRVRRKLVLVILSLTCIWFPSLLVEIYIIHIPICFIRFHREQDYWTVFIDRLCLLIYSAWFSQAVQNAGFLGLRCELLGAQAPEVWISVTDGSCIAAAVAADGWIRVLRCIADAGSYC